MVKTVNLVDTIHKRVENIEEIPKLKSRNGVIPSTLLARIRYGNNVSQTTTNSASDTVSTRPDCLAMVT